MPKNVIARLARATSCYTGEAHEQLLNRLKAVPAGSAPIPEASLEQACVEREVFSALAWPKHIALHPWGGIHSVVPAPEHLTIVFEGDHVASHAAMLLPRVDKYKDVRGVPGLRVDGWTDGELRLRVLGSNAGLSLRGLSRVAWTAAVADLSATARESKEQMCPGRLTKAEKRAAAGNLRSAGNAAWLTSGVLRRVALFNSIGMPVYFTSWPSSLGDGHERWCFDLDHQPRSGVCEHHAFQKALTDETFGMPLRVIHAVCNVDKLGHGSCAIDLGSANGRPGRLNLRFNRREGERVQSWLREFPGFMRTRQQMWGAPDREPLAEVQRWQLRRERMTAS